MQYRLAMRTDNRALLNQLTPLPATVPLREARLTKQAFKDVLTDVANRRYFRLRLEEEVRRHLRIDQPLSLVFVDVDRFQAISDAFGHSAGDAVLTATASVLLNQSRRSTTISRYGEDEFAILLVDTPKTAALSYAVRMKRVIERYPFGHGTVTASLGVAAMPDDASSAEELLTAAGRALSEAKRLGRNAVAPA